MATQLKDLLLATKATKTKKSSNNQFNDQHSLKTFDAELFGSHTASAKPGDYGGVSNWVSEFTDASIPPTATIATSQNDYLIGSIRYPAGTFANYLDWASEYIGGDGGAYKEIFQKDNIYKSINSAIISYGNSLKYSLSSFTDYATILSTSRIHVCLNVYTQSIAEIKAAVDKFKTTLNNDSRVIYWEMGNELDGEAYQDYANDAAEPGSFPNLTGADLTKAKEYFPEERFNENIYARKIKEVCKYIRDNYPSDKIGLTSSAYANYSKPQGGPSWIPLGINRKIAWAQACQNHIPDSYYDATIMHPYISVNGTDYDSLAADPIPTSGKELDASLTDQEDKLWRFHITMAQEYLRLSRENQEQLWPNKEIWVTEWGILTGAFDSPVAEGVATTGSSGTALVDSLATFQTNVVEVNDKIWNVTQGTYSTVASINSETSITLNDAIMNVDDVYEIATKNQPTSIKRPDQYILRTLFIASFFISLLKENIKFRGRTTITTSMYHVLLRGSVGSSQYYLTGYYNANSLAFVLFRKAIDNMTHAAIPVLDDAGVQFDGQDPLSQTKIHPVRAVFFDGGGEQKMFIVNISPTSRTAVIPFSSASGRKIEASGTPPDPLEQIADSTYGAYTDLASSSVASTSMVLAPFSVHSVVNTGSYVDLNNFVLSVT